MFSKLGKILASAALFGALAFNSSTAFADGGMACNKPAKKKCHTECVKPCETPCEIMPMHQKKECMDGMMFGVFGDFGVGINSNSDFALGVIKTGTGNPPVPAADTTAVTFIQRRDSAYGGGVQFGWMMANSLEAFIELSYKQIQNKSSSDNSNKIESDILSGMIGVNYFVDLFNGLFLPFVGVAGGIARNKASGTIYDKPNHEEANVITFDNLVKTHFCYQVGIGVATNFDNAILGLEYKFFTGPSVSSSNSDFTVNVVDPDGAGGALANPSSVNFGSLKNNAHFLTVFFKFLF